MWANLDLATYEAFADPLHFWVNEIGMVFFFALAAKEVFEATLPGGALASLRQALSPLAAAVGGMVAPAAIYTSLALTLGPASLTRGWAIPCATDIAFSAMVARLIFPKGHPAIPFLLLLAIVDDALGLSILAVFYPSATLSLTWLFLLLTAAMLLAVVLRRRRIRSFWPYVIGPGSLSWAALHYGGLHPALALVPIVPFMPHSARDLGLFNPREERQPDTLSRFEHWWAECNSCCCSSDSPTLACRSNGLDLARTTCWRVFFSASRSGFCSSRPRHFSWVRNCQKNCAWVMC